MIVAIGQVADLSFAPAWGLEPQGGLAADPVTLETCLPGVFAGGDVYYGPRSVVEAVENGKEAAESIHRYLNGLDLKGESRKRLVACGASTRRRGLKKAYAHRVISQWERKGAFKEVALGFTRRRPGPRPTGASSAAFARNATSALKYVCLVRLIIP